MRKYFGTDGIRRIANTELTPELVYKVAKAGAYVLSKHTDHTPTILIGRDTRISGTLIESAMVAGFLSYGANVKLLGVLPTPAVAYLTRKLNADASIMISASHNGAEYNGIKILGKNGTKISDEEEEEIEEQIELILKENKVSADHKSDKEKLDNKVNEIAKSNINLEINQAKKYSQNKEMEFEKIQNKYIEFFAENFKKEFDNFDKKNLVVAIDTANGATSQIAEKVYNKLGIHYKIINNTPDGKNINENCGSTKIEGLKKFVVENKCTLGIAYDGDGDRCIAVDENGCEINGDVIMGTMAKHLKTKGKLTKDTLVLTVMSNIGLIKYCKENKINYVQTKVGDRYVLEEMQKEGYNLGGEQSGHIIFMDYTPTGDGILTSLMLIKVMLETKESASKLSSKIKRYPQVLVNAKVSAEKKYDFEKDEEIQEKINQLNQEFKDNGRVLIRASGTENLVRVMIEGENQDYLNHKAQELAEFIETKCENHSSFA